MKAIKKDGTVDWALATKLLQEPFNPDRLKWRVGSVAKSGKRCTLLCYLDARDIDRRMNEVFGLSGWQVRFPEKGNTSSRIWCEISIRDGFNGSGDPIWIIKEDAGKESQIESEKGGVSDAKKRTAVVLGIGSYLYSLDSGWIDIMEGWAPKNGGGSGINISSRDGHLGWVLRPNLPDEALPKSDGWAKLHRKFFAVIGEADITYDDVCLFCKATGRARPSRMPEETLSSMINFLSDENGLSVFINRLESLKEN